MLPLSSTDFILMKNLFCALSSLNWTEIFASAVFGLVLVFIVDCIRLQIKRCKLMRYKGLYIAKEKNSLKPLAIIDLKRPNGLTMRFEGYPLLIQIILVTYQYKI